MCDLLFTFIYFYLLLSTFRMLKLSKGGLKEEAEVINQMLMPLHERYVQLQCAGSLYRSLLSIVFSMRIWICDAFQFNNRYFEVSS